MPFFISCLPSLIPPLEWVFRLTHAPRPDLGDGLWIVSKAYLSPLSKISHGICFILTLSSPKNARPSWNSFPIAQGGALVARFHIVQKIRPWKSQECSISRPKGEPYLMVTPTWQARWYWITDSSPSVPHMLGPSWVRKNTNSRKPSISVLLWSAESQSSTLRICLQSPLCFLLFWVLGQSSIP